MRRWAPTVDLRPAARRAPKVALKPLMRALSVVVLGAAVIPGCAPNGTATPGGEASVVAHREVVTDLVGPTQIAIGDDGRWWVAQLNGGEDSSMGQVVVIDPGEPDAGPRVVVDGLAKPTGIALFGDELWVMERDRLTRGPTDGGPRQVVIDDLPNNGRSEGSLTVDGERLLFNTSGSLRDGEVVPDSGVLWAVDARGDISQVADGFKHAYAQTRGGDGTLFTTEIGDGSYDGEPPMDEIVAVTPGLNHGWPTCVGDNRVVAQYGGTKAICESVPSSHAVFAAGATPTSIVVTPWDPEVLLVALWNEGRVVAISAAEPGGEIVEVLNDIEHPQHLAVSGDVVLVTDHTAGSIIELSLRP